MVDLLTNKGTRNNTMHV